MKRLLKVSVIIAGMASCTAGMSLDITSDANGTVMLPDRQLHKGERAPVVTLVDSRYKPVTIGGVTGKVQIISTIESFNTSVCDQQSMLLNDMAKELPDASVTVVTTNQPFIVDAFEKKHPLPNIKVLSAFDNKAFGMKYGVQVVGGELRGITARSVFVVAPDGDIVYKEITSNIDHMPNLKAVYKAAKSAIKQ
ncbi:redoxin family protein [Fangia hongkongensis]|uniref:redoxin family protein n=1 Tax=Fangia hongkongensis TaxID=270495 RepID=UPI00036281B5|nr:redoxin family protein [Fangia hongkongensis]MBK2125294.1 redoxin family protein [Fangia hongkongensis]